MRLGPYEIVGLLGAGGMGEVYRAHDARLGRDVAIKVLPGAWAADPERLQRFEQEARAAAALNHPNILAVHDIGTSGDAPYIVTELLDGGTLRDALSAGALPQRKAVEYAMQIAQGLAAAHEKGIVHRDLKPENLFVTSDERVKILDFGLAKLMQAESAFAGASLLPTGAADPAGRPNTVPGMVMGTVGYMAPEQVRGAPADHRADIFACGAVLYEMLAGRRAFQRETAVETMAAILNTEPPALSSVEPAIPPGLEKIVYHCLEKHPAARFGTAHDLAFALENLSSSSDIRTGAVAAIPTRHWTAKRLAWSAIAAVLVISTAWLIAISRPEGSTANETVIRAAVDLPDLSLSGDADHFLSVSPDGRRIVFAAQDPGGRRQLWQRAIDGATPQPIVGTDNARDPFWSPDSQVIAFFADGKLKKVDTGGGPVTILSDTRSGAGGTWSRDNVIVFSDFSNLYRVPAAGGMPVLIAGREAGDPDNLYQFPSFLPDSDHFIHRGRGGQTYVRSLSTNDVKLLGAGGNAQYANGRVVFWRDGALLAQALDTARLELTDDVVRIAEEVRGIANGAAFAVSQNGVLVYQRGSAESQSELTWFDRAGRRLETVGGPAEFGDLELSPDDVRLAVTIRDPARQTGDIWFVDVRSGRRTAFTFDPAEEAAPAWSPDGATVIFDSNRTGRSDLYAKPSNGSAAETLLFGTEDVERTYGWSPDGRYVVFQAAGDIFALPLTGDRKPVPLVTGPGAASSARVSPDGRWIAYVSNETGRQEVWVAPFQPSGGKWLVSTGGGIFPRWRADGREIFYLDPSNTLMAAAVGGAGSGFEVLSVTRLFEAGAVSTSRRSMYVVSRDGQRFLINSLSEQPASSPLLSLVVNWPALLQR